MPNILDIPQANVQSDLDSLENALDNTLPLKTNNNILIATWNIRSFASLTRKWMANTNNSSKRDLRGLIAICKIVSRFDVVAIQEVKGNLRALRDMMKYLGNGWSFLMTDITLGDKGNNERIAFVFDNSRLQPSGLACELVIPPEGLEIGIDENGVNEIIKNQFVRTPYAVSFRAKDETFILISLQVNYGDSNNDRIPELKAIAKWMADWADRETKWHHNLITLGDFNIDRQDDVLWKAFTSTGLFVPNELNQAAHTIFKHPNEPEKDKYYDQIAWFEDNSGHPNLTMEYKRGGLFDFLPYVYSDTNLSKLSISYRISDHYPLWAEFSI